MTSFSPETAARLLECIRQAIPGCCTDVCEGKPARYATIMPDQVRKGEPGIPGQLHFGAYCKEHSPGEDFRPALHFVVDVEADLTEMQFNKLRSWIAGALPRCLKKGCENQRSARYAVISRPAILAGLIPVLGFCENHFPLSEELDLTKYVVVDLGG